MTNEEVHQLVQDLEELRRQVDYLTASLIVIKAGGGGPERPARIIAQADQLAEVIQLRR